MALLRLYGHIRVRVELEAGQEVRPTAQSGNDGLDIGSW